MLNNKGVTLVEILVSLAISAIIMMYGISFFVGAARTGTASYEYEFALQEAKNIIEERISTFGGDVNSQSSMGDADRGFLADRDTRFNADYRSVQAQGTTRAGAATAQGRSVLRSSLLAISWPVEIDASLRKGIIIQVRTASPYVRKG